MDSDFDIDEGDEPDSDQEEDAPKRKSRVVTKAYKVELIVYSILLQSKVIPKTSPNLQNIQVNNLFSRLLICIFHPYPA